MADQLLEAGGTKVALATRKTFMNLKLRVRWRALRTERDAAWVLKSTRVLTQIVREPHAQLFRNAVLSVKMGCDLRVPGG